MKNKFEEVERIFLSAIDLPKAERAQFVKFECRDDADMEHSVMAVLNGERDSHSILDNAPAAAAVALERSASSREEQPGVPSRQDSVLDALSSTHGFDSLLLREEPGKNCSVVRPDSPEIPDRHSSDRYQLQGEIARGGMGAILRGVDTDLGRGLAIKVLLDRHKDKPEVIQRFVEEAQIGGQLQHPGIAPVYELGQFEDGRPYFTMKLVNGETFASMLANRARHDSDRAKLVNIFAQVCHTIAYAHTRGVIHRDLKPANIMVGAFGEVQVMDWGVAKVLSSGGLADEKKLLEAGKNVAESLHESENEESSLVGTGRSLGSQTIAGSLMGTPAYMAPEQALGDIEHLDERCDVFGLGAVLCEVLTGLPPYHHDKPSKVLEMATHGMLDECLDRLDACAADPTLIALTRNCLQKNPTRRPTNAGAVAEAVSGYLESVELRLRESELERVAESTRSVETRKRHRITLALASTILMTITLASIGYFWNQNKLRNQAIAATERVNEKLIEARFQQSVAEQSELADQHKAYEKAFATAVTALELSKADSIDKSVTIKTEALVREITSKRLAVEKAATDAAAERKLLSDLESANQIFFDGGDQLDLRVSANNFDAANAQAAYAVAFDDFGRNFFKLPESQIVDWVRSSPIKDEVLNAIDHWSRCFTPSGKVGEVFPWVTARDWNTSLKTTRSLAVEKRRQWLFYVAINAFNGTNEEYAEACQVALRENEGIRDVVFSQELCFLSLLRPDLVEFDEYLTDWSNLLEQEDLSADLLWWKGRAGYTSALRSYRDGDFERSIRRTNDTEFFSPIDTSIGSAIRAMAHHRLGEQEQAKKYLTTAENTYRFALKIYSRASYDYICAKVLLIEATALIRPGKDAIQCKLDLIPKVATPGSRLIGEILYEDSINQKLLSVANQLDSSEFRRSIRTAIDDVDTAALKRLSTQHEIGEQSPQMVASLATALLEESEVDSAIGLLKRSLFRAPDDYWLNYLLGKCLIENDQLEEGLGYARAALAIRPKSVGAMWVVTSALSIAKRNSEAMEQFEVLVANSNLSANGYQGLALNMTENYGNHEAGAVAIEKALEMEPENSLFRAVYALTFIKRGNENEALEQARLAVELNPNGFAPRAGYAEMLSRTGRIDEAIKQVRAGCKMWPRNGLWFHKLAVLLYEHDGDESEALELFEKAAELESDNSKFQSDLAKVYRVLGMSELASKTQAIATKLLDEDGPRLRKRVEEQPRSAQAHYALGANLLKRERLHDAIKVFKRSIELDRNPDSFRRLGSAYYQLERFEDAIEAWKTATELDIENAEFYELVASAYQQLGDFENTEKWCRKALEFNDNFVGAKQRLSDLAEIAKTQDIANQNPRDLKAQQDLLEVYQDMEMTILMNQQKKIVLELKMKTGNAD